MGEIASVSFFVIPAIMHGSNTKNHTKTGELIADRFPSEIVLNTVNFNRKEDIG